MSEIQKCPNLVRGGGSTFIKKTEKFGKNSDLFEFQTFLKKVDPPPPWSDFRHF